MFRARIFRPLRDYAMVDLNGNQILARHHREEIPTLGRQPSLGAAGITCDFCHDRERARP